MRTIDVPTIGNRKRVTNAPDGYTFTDGVVVAAGDGGTPFETQSGIVGDPETVRGMYLDSRANKVVYVYGIDTELKKAATGIYYFDVTFTFSGDWFARLEGTGVSGIIAAAQLKFVVARSAFA